jgi:transketolase
VKVRVVSLPSWERFEAQPTAYRDEVLPPPVRARLSIESGVSLGWDRWVDTREGAILAIDRFGLSAPAAQIFERFGFTVEHVAELARGVLSGDVRGVISPDAEHPGTTLDAAEAR